MAPYGYSAVVGHGISMELALRNGDALWVKYLDPAEEKVAVAFIRVHFAGYVLDFLANIIVRALLIGAMVTLAIIWVRRRRTAHSDE